MHHIDWCKITTTKLNDVATLAPAVFLSFMAMASVDFKESK